MKNGNDITDTTTDMSAIESTSILKKGHHKLTGGEMSAIIISGVVVVISIVIGLVFGLRKSKKPKKMMPYSCVDGSCVRASGDDGQFPTSTCGDGCYICDPTDETCKAAPNYNTDGKYSTSICTGSSCNAIKNKSYICDVTTGQCVQTVPGEGQFDTIECGKGCLKCGEDKCVPVQNGEIGTANFNTCADVCPCPKGTSVIYTTTNMCYPCSAGSFSDTINAPSCTFCDPGSYSSSSGAEKCVQCEGGSIAPTTGSIGCVPCETGEFSPPGGTQCMQCSKGTVAPRPASTCTPCDPGTIASTTGLGVCTPCDAGQYASGTGNSECTPCPEGSASSSTGSSTCEPCTPGTIATNKGSVTCTPCRPGYYAPGDGDKECLPCDPGFIAPNDGTSTCKACPAGTVSANPASTECTTCATGTFQNQAGQATCKPCKRDGIECPWGIEKACTASNDTVCTPSPYGFDFKYTPEMSPVTYNTNYCLSEQMVSVSSCMEYASSEVTSIKVSFGQGDTCPKSGQPLTTMKILMDIIIGAPLNTVMVFCNLLGFSSNAKYPPVYTPGSNPVIFNRMSESIQTQQGQWAPGALGTNAVSFSVTPVQADGLVIGPTTISVVLTPKPIPPPALSQVNYGQAITIVGLGPFSTNNNRNRRARGKKDEYTQIPVFCYVFDVCTGSMNCMWDLTCGDGTENNRLCTPPDLKSKDEVAVTTPKNGSCCPPV